MGSRRKEEIDAIALLIDLTLLVASYKQRGQLRKVQTIWSTAFDAGVEHVVRGAVLEALAVKHCNVGRAIVGRGNAMRDSPGRGCTTAYRACEALELPDRT